MNTVTRIRLEQDVTDAGYPYKIFRVVENNQILWTRIMLRKEAIKYAISEARRFGVQLVVEPGILKRKDGEL